MKNISGLLLLIIVFVGCVGQEDLYDGLVDNIPSVVNKAKAFTYALKADNYDFVDAYALSFNTTDSSFISTTILITDAPQQDSVTVTFFDGSNSPLREYRIYGDFVYTGYDSISVFDPQKIVLKGEAYSGIVQCVLTITE